MRTIAIFRRRARADHWTIGIGGQRRRPLPSWPAPQTLHVLGGTAVSEMTAETLAEHLALLKEATVDDLDELLEDFLVQAWPTKRGQDN